jgi:leucyl aminopeptidase (aminopeptidase T)
MKRTPSRIVAVILMAVVIVALGAGPTAGQSQADMTALSEKLVDQCAGIEEGDLVLIVGGIRDAQLLEDIAVGCRKLGAFPLISLGIEKKDRRYYDEVDSRYDSQAPKFDILVANNVDAIIGIDYYETQGLMAGIPPERITAVRKALVPVNEIYLTRNIRQLYLGNNVYPTASNAEIYGVTQEQLSNLFWDGLNVDYATLQTTCERVKNVLSDGSEFRITNPNGTDFKVGIKGRPVLYSDGVIGPEDRRLGGANCSAYLPAGEVYFVPVPGTALGKIVVDRQIYQGKEIIGLELTYDAGKLVSMSSKSGLEPLQAYYDASDEGKEDLSYIDIGTNPNVMLPAGSNMNAWMAAGMVTVGNGNNYWTGGDNRSTYETAHFLRGCTVTVDGKKIIDAGRLLPQ